MNAILEAILLQLLVFYYTVEAIILFFLPSRKKDVKGQTVLITGAGCGLGRLFAHRFARLGCVTVLWDINAAGNEETASQLREFGATCHTYTCDVSSKESVYHVAEKVMKDVGDVDILINNAGIVTGKKLLDCPDAMVEKTMVVNVMAHFWIVKSFLPAMLRKDKGHIVSIASSAGFFGVSGLVDYCSSKFAAVGFDESLRSELRSLNKTGIRTTCVCPYYISTGMFAGVTHRFPSLTPELTPEYVVDKSVTAILTNQQLIMIPKDMYLLAAMKSLLPIKAMTKIAQFYGTDSSMNTFQGRHKEE